MASSAGSLPDRLASRLPKDQQFLIQHLSTIPSSCDAIFAAAPGHTAEATSCANNFLSVSVGDRGDATQILAIEVLIYSTKDLTTLFVSKADSTGYLYPLNLPQGTPSPIRTIATVFLDYLLEQHITNDHPTIVSLFARSQNQYLFPGSVENARKHVLDDIGLIKWWCKVVDPLLDQKSSALPVTNANNLPQGASEVHQSLRGCGYLRVPGHDSYGTRALFPKSAASQTNGQRRWTVGDPLLQLHSSSPNLPERCLIPRFPDDPKARFLIDLDDEIITEDGGGNQKLGGTPSSSQGLVLGRWKSVQSLEQFWEMMSFRQECSAGRAVGFLWLYFWPSDRNSKARFDETLAAAYATLPTPISSQQEKILPSSQTAEADLQPHAEQIQNYGSARHHEDHRLAESSPSEAVLPQEEYKKAIDLLLSLDYENLTIARESSAKWTKHIAEKASLESWGQTVTGQSIAPPSMPATDAINHTSVTLNAGLIRKKKRANADSSPEGEGSQINTLAANLVRKKAKPSVDADPSAFRSTENAMKEYGTAPVPTSVKTEKTAAPASTDSHLEKEQQANIASAPKPNHDETVNKLASGLIRKKIKPDLATNFQASSKIS